MRSHTKDITTSVNGILVLLIVAVSIVIVIAAIRLMVIYSHWQTPWQKKWLPGRTNTPWRKRLRPKDRRK